MHLANGSPLQEIVKLAIDCVIFANDTPPQDVVKLTIVYVIFVILLIQL
jgi:hypothetical protein